MDNSLILKIVEKIKEIQQIDDDTSEEKENNKNESTKVKTIAKRQRKKRAKIFITPIYFNNCLKVDDEPIYIFFFKKIMKSYDNTEFNKYRGFGMQDAGVGKIEQIIFDKVNENLQIYLRTNTFGIINFDFLIKLYKSYQDQQYYDLSVALEKYQKFANEESQIMFNNLNSRHRKNKNKQEKIDSAFSTFEQDVQDWANENLKDELYEIVIGTVQLEKGIPVLRKKIFSKNYIMFIGGDLNQLHNRLQIKTMKESFCFLLNGDEFNGKLQLEKMITMINASMNGTIEYSFNDEIITFEGVTIPTIKTVQTIFYNYKKRTFQPKKGYHFMDVHKYSFDSNWIKYLIDLRQKQSSIPKALTSNISSGQSSMDIESSSDQFIENFDFICQQEYFLEKFDYM